MKLNHGCHRLVFFLLLARLIQVPCTGDPLQAYWVDSSNIDVDILTVRSFQGIVNRDAPRLFVVEWENDLRWIEIFAERYSDSIKLKELQSTEELFKHPELRELCSTMVVYDKSDSQLAMNGALTLAGIHGACAVDDTDLDTMMDLGFRIVDDRRDFPGWQTNEGVNQWALTVQRQTNQAFYCVSEGLIRGSPKSVDTAVSLGMLWFLLDSRGDHQDDQDVQEQILSLYPPHTIATGWWTSEVHDVRMISRHGHTFATNSVNCSFFRHGTNFIDIGRQKAPTGPLPGIEPDKVYAFISYTQGDAIYFCSDRNMNQWTAVSDDGTGRLVREKYPFGLMHNSIQTILQPMVPAYLYDTQYPPNQWFSGKAYGYAYPSTLLEGGYLAEHLDRGGAAMEEMDILDLMLNDRAAFLGTSDTSLIEHIVHIIDRRPRSLIIKHPFSEKAGEKDPPMLFNGIPAFGDPVMERTDKEKRMDIAATADAIYSSMQKRQFFWIFLNNQATASELEDLFQFMEKDSRFGNLVLMNPDAFIRLYASRIQDPFSWRITDDTWLGEDPVKSDNGDQSRLRIGQNGSLAILRFEVDSMGGAERIHLRLLVDAKKGDRLVLHRLPFTGWHEENISSPQLPGTLLRVGEVVLSGGEQEVFFDVTRDIDSAGVYTFCLKSDSGAALLSVSSRESKNPPWLLAN